MKGQRTLDDRPFRYGGILHNYSADNDEWQEKAWSHVKKAPMRCWCCNGIMKNSRSQSGTLLRQNFPYMGVFKITKGKHKGKFQFKALCRACAYAYGRGVVEMDAETYMNPDDFDEMQYKEESGYGKSDLQRRDAVS